MHKFILTPALFEKVCTLLAGAAGLQFDPSKLSALQMHLRDRARAHHCATFEEYYRFLTDHDTGRDELRKLIEAIMIHETSFFRNHEHFRALREIVLPTVARHNAATRALRIWSAGCATGEEPYSLAITCLEQAQLAGWNLAIEATDLSERVLALARRGKFRADALRYLEPDRLARWFERQTQEAVVPGARRGTGPFDPIFGQREVYLISERVRKLVHFGVLNLAQPPYAAGYRDFDLIVCENVLIYLQPEVMREIVQQFYECLRPGGYLFLGYSETLWQISNRFQLITCPNTFFYRKPLEEAPAPPAPRPRSGRELQEALRKRDPFTPPAAIPAPDAGLAGLLRRAERDGVPVTPALGQSRVPPAPATDVERSLALASAAQLIRRAQEHLEAGRYTEAQEAFTTALTRNSSAVEALVGLAQIHANQGRLKEARAECEKALAIDALCEEAHLLSALIARQQGLLDEAIDHFEKLLYINIESITGHYHLAELYRVEERVEEAVREYRRALWALGRHRGTKTVNGLPASMIRQACEQQIRRLATSA